MTDLPEAAASVPAYMAQKSVTLFSEQGHTSRQVDHSWTAVPCAPQQALLKSSMSVVQPRTTHDEIAAKNEELLRVVARETQGSDLASAVCAFLSLHELCGIWLCNFFFGGYQTLLRS
jgi:hypothetical protein